MAIYRGTALILSEIVNILIMQRTSLVIEGNIILKQTVPAFSNSTIHIYVEDISYADSKASTLAHVTITDVSHNDKAETVIPFRIEVKDKNIVDDNADFGVRAWINMKNDGIANSRDLFSDTSIPVFANGEENQVEIIFN